MHTRKWGITVMLIGLMVVLTDCEDIASNAEKGRTASAEFCDCFEKKSLNTCFDNLKSKYETYEYESDAFIEAFNDANDCGAKLYKEYIKSSVPFGGERPETLLILAE